MTVRRSVRARNFTEALESLTSDATAPEQAPQGTTAASPYVGGGLAAQMNSSGGNFSGYAQIFSGADLERLFGINPRVDISQLDLDSPNAPAEPEPTREEVIAANYPEFAEQEGIGEVPTEEVQQEVNNEQVIPANSNSLLISEETSRFSSAIWYDKIREQRIILAGAGGIGSYVGFLLSRMHPARITIYDDDVVEEGNLSGQLYADYHIGNLCI